MTTSTSGSVAPPSTVCSPSAGVSAAAVGELNYIDQNATQTSVQDQLDLGAYSIPATPDAQTSVQMNTNEAAAVGELNYIDQDATQTSVQDQVDLNQYLPSHY